MTKKLLIAFDPRKPERRSSDFLVVILEGGQPKLFDSSSIYTRAKSLKATAVVRPEAHVRPTNKGKVRIEQLVLQDQPGHSPLYFHGGAIIRF